MLAYTAVNPWLRCWSSNTRCVAHATKAVSGSSSGGGTTSSSDPQPPNARPSGRVRLYRRQRQQPIGLSPQLAPAAAPPADNTNTSGDGNNSRGDSNITSSSDSNTNGGKNSSTSSTSNTRTRLGATAEELLSNWDFHAAFGPDADSWDVLPPQAPPAAQASPPGPPLKGGRLRKQGGLKREAGSSAPTQPGAAFGADGSSVAPGAAAAPDWLGGTLHTTSEPDADGSSRNDGSSSSAAAAVFDHGQRAAADDAVDLRDDAIPPACYWREELEAFEVWGNMYYAVGMQRKMQLWQQIGMTSCVSVVCIFSYVAQACVCQHTSKQQQVCADTYV